MKYDSILYGNGLTLHTLGMIQKKSDDPFAKYLSVDDFAFDVIDFENHRRVVRIFEKILHLDEEHKRIYDDTKEHVRQNIAEVMALGFERWANKYLFCNASKVPEKISSMSNDDVIKQLGGSPAETERWVIDHMYRDLPNTGKITEYMYVLYNYWFDYINQSFLQKKSSRDIVQKVSDQIRMCGKEQCRYFTLNFDTIHDFSLKPDHLHGKFISPFIKMKDIFLDHVYSKKDIYTFSFGTNGIEKLQCVHDIHSSSTSQSSYDLSFFFDEELSLGNLLILGVGFSNTELTKQLEQSEDLRDILFRHMREKAKSEIENHSVLASSIENPSVLASIASNVDGHIFHTLKSKIENRTLDSITISYHEESEIEHYKCLLNSAGLSSCTDFVPSIQILGE